MQVKLTSKGQLVIPKPIRDALHLRAGDRLDVQVINESIILAISREPDQIEALCGSLAGVDMLSELEEEHRREVLDE
jgi:AbrB family looped-hinge helix DNA binding protein